MNKEKQMSVKSIKAQISEKTKDFEKRLMSARNAFELCKVFSEIIDILEAEILQLLAQIENLGQEKTALSETMAKELSDHVFSIKELQEKFKASHAEFLPNGLNIQKVMIQNGELPGPVLKEF